MGGYYLVCHEGTRALDGAFEVARDELVFFCLNGCDVAVVLQEGLGVTTFDTAPHLYLLEASLSHVFHFHEPGGYLCDEGGIVGVGKQGIG